MKKGTLLTLLGGPVLAGYVSYRYRRQLNARLLNLPPVVCKVKVDHSIFVSMLDGVKLATSHYAPTTAGNYPTILIRTPYGRKGLVSSSSNQTLAERGYHVVVQDVRGRFASEGEFEPVVNEVADGQATIDWIKKQSWFNGKIGTWGASYLGFVQWAIATANPPELQAIVPCITSSNFYSVTREVFGLDGMLFWLQILKADTIKGLLQNVLYLVETFGTASKKRLVADKRMPISDADEAVVGKPVPFYQHWLEHSEADDPYWQASDFSSKVGQVQAPAHFVSGWYDFMLRQLLEDYARLQAAGKKPYLTIGPWGHLSVVGSFEQLRQGLFWFEAMLKGDKRRLRRAPVRYFVTGTKEWREIESWPPPAQTQAYYLHSQQRLATEQPTDSLPDQYRFNPADPTPSIGGSIFSPQAGPQDNWEIEARPDVLTYTSVPLTQNLEAIGPVRFQLYARSSLEYTDFFGRLCEVWPDGRSLNVCDNIVRIHPGVGQPQSDGSLCLELDFSSIAHRFQAGNSLRMQVSSGSFPRFNRNNGTGESLMTATQLLVAEQTIYHDATHPSAVFLSIVTA